jgi:uncharacterized protein (UPF0261 family)
VGLFVVPIHTDGGAFYDPTADQAFIDALQSDLNPEIPVRLVPEHINTEAFAQAAVDELLALMKKAEIMI